MQWRERADHNLMTFPSKDRNFSSGSKKARFEVLMRSRTLRTSGMLDGCRHLAADDI
jgi:hypothetical protein